MLGYIALDVMHVNLVPNFSLAVFHCLVLLITMYSIDLFPTFSLLYS